MSDILKTVHGNLTGASAAVIAVVLLLGQLGIIGSPLAEISLDGESKRQIADLAVFTERVTIEHKYQLEVTKEMIAELRALSEINKEMLLIIRDMKQELRRSP